MKTRTILVVVFSFVLLFDISAQKDNRKITITGRVTDSYYSPVIKALIMIDGETSYVKTDIYGHYKVRVKPSASEIGVFTTISGVVEKQIEGRTRIDFILEKNLFSQPLAPDDNEVVIYDGYGYARESGKTKPITSTDISSNRYASFATIYEILKTIPGVTVVGESVNIRGVGTIGSSAPLFVVNGITVSSVTGIDPAMVRSIDVLKGPAASVYGLEGGNGVILIHTKSGR